MYVFSQLVFGFAFSKNFKRKERFYIKQVLFGILAIFLAAVAQKFSSVNLDSRKDPMVLILTSTVLFCGCIYFFISFWIYKSYEVDVREAIYATSMGYLTQHLFYCSTNYIESLFRINRVASTVLEIIMMVFIAILIYNFIAKRMIFERHYIAPTAETIGLLVLMIILVLVLSSMASVYGFVKLHSFYGALFCIYILLSQMERQRILFAENESKIKEQLLVTQQAQYKAYKENIDLINRKTHDLKHQIAALRIAHDDETGQQVINSIAGTVRIYDSFIRTGNDGLDTILTGKNQICLEKDILFTCIVDGKLLDFLNPVDLYTFFGNMLDNAIEAVSKLPIEKRSISLMVREELGMVMISEENPYLLIDKNDDGFVTTKPDKENHGYGIKSMELVVEKYDGTISIDISNDTFSLVVFLNTTA